MGRRFHRGFTAAEKTELWDRWKRGESLKAIGRAFGKPSSSIHFLVAPHGGTRPAQRRRSRLALTLAEREVIFQRRYGTSIGTIDRQVAWPLTLDGEPGNEPQRRLETILNVRNWTRSRHRAQAKPIYGLAWSTLRTCRVISAPLSRC